MSHVGCRFDTSPLVLTVSVGSRLTRFAPDRTLNTCAGDMAPDRLLRMLPASPLTVPSSRNRGGGAKSSPVNVPDLRSANLQKQQLAFTKKVERKEKRQEEKRKRERKEKRKKERKKRKERKEQKNKREKSKRKEKKGKDAYGLGMAARSS